MEAIPVTHDTTLFRFAANLPDVETPSGIIVPSHVVVKDDSCQIAREYTPITYSKTHFDLLVKKYENGSVSKLIHSLEPGDKLEMRGPIETLPYEPNVVEEIGMIAGGTGISPLYQLIKRILRDPSDKTRISLIYANRSEDDIPLHNELQLLSSKHPDRLRVYHTIEKQRHQERPWGQGTGYVSAKMIKEHLPASERGSSAAILVCGPDGMIQYVAGAKEENNSQGPLGGLLAKLGYQERQVFKF
ncbi:hypothetical protein BC832DRAFT_535628 [Gaertneriomyces semiglobifer]|nr:hypothetical protein BC832DRAFT_535628 [Gaertneriomyces semiglobifer]